jgi:hypothetical protein
MRTPPTSEGIEGVFGFAAAFVLVAVSLAAAALVLGALVLVALLLVA